MSKQSWNRVVLKEAVAAMIVYETELEKPHPRWIKQVVNRIASLALEPTPYPEAFSE
ncbi:hypothetical protein [Candidatus Poriferisocius sp.]|uniref:hypothetical protein n=1 Tax=Candidatus Poriferisocius sp. TaxID=3101276 RepID=UPI003B518DCA